MCDERYDTYVNCMYDNLLLDDILAVAIYKLQG